MSLKKKLSTTELEKKDNEQPSKRQDTRNTLSTQQIRTSGDTQSDKLPYHPKPERVYSTGIPVLSLPSKSCFPMIMRALLFGFATTLLAATLLATPSMAFATARPLIPAVPDVASPLPLSAVRLTGGPLKHAQDLDAAYLLQLEPDRMMAYYRARAGLAPKAQGYDGWDGDGRNLTGHIAGHYLSAVSLMYAATGDARFKARADYLVAQMKEVQDKNGNGYLGALEGGQEKFAQVAHGDIHSGGFDLNGLWSPWYTLHKTYAGLRDAYRYTGNQTALECEIKYAAWAEGILAHLDEAQTQKMLNTEFGGMSEVFADLYADTSDARWLTLSHRFDHHSVVDPLARREDKLGGLHANTQIPKLIGSLAQYVDSGDQKAGTAAQFFWDTVVDHHSFATGGHGKDEYFGPSDDLSARVDGRTDESCNVYNMLKMTRTLFALQPDIKYAEFEERALFNHVLGSIDPTDGRTCYMVPVGRSVEHEYQDMFHNFTCCVGSGMENHALHGAGIYYASQDRLWVNLYAPSTANWAAGGAKLTLNTDFPEGASATLKLEMARPKKFTLMLRRPSWAGEGFAVKINGRTVNGLNAPRSYIPLSREWKTGDDVTLTLPKGLHAEPLSDNPQRIALMWGPLVLAGDMGPENKPQSTPVFVGDQGALSTWLQPVAGTPGGFRSVGAGRDITPAHLGQEQEVGFVPFYRLHRRSYTLYWDVLSAPQWETKSAQIAIERETQRKLEAATVGFAQPGEMQPERDYNQQGEASEPVRVMGHAGRKSTQWFSFEMPVDPAHPMTLIATYNTDEWRTRTFDILVDGQKLAAQTVERKLPGHFFDADYAIPAALVAGKTKVTVRFQATGGNETAALYGLRTIRGDLPR